MWLGVHDGDPTEPSLVPGKADADAESGRGLGIVRALADEVAIEQIMGDGKTIYLTFASRVRGDEPI